MASDRLVLDSSFALEVVLPTKEEWRREAVDLIERIAARDIDARVPWLFFAEVAAIVTRKGVRSRVIDPVDAVDFLQRIDSLGMHVDLTLEQSLSLHTAAMLWNAGTYDAVYIDVARRMAIPVASRDKGMVAACRVAGVAVF